MYSKRIVLKNTDNTRSLSDLINRSGKKIKSDLLLRSDALDRIEEDDQRILDQTYHLKRVIDLRTESEAAHHPDRLKDHVQWIFLPVLEDKKIGMTKTGDVEMDFVEFTNEIHRSGVKSSERFMANTYASLLESEKALQAYRTFLKLLLEETDGATLWHCSAGKDRAGFATILVLYLLDFSWDTIVEDYLATNRFYEPVVQKMKNRLGEEYEETLWCVYGVKESYLEALLKAIDLKYGSFEGYIRNGLQFSVEDQRKLKEIYLGD